MVRNECLIVLFGLMDEVELIVWICDVESVVIMKVGCYLLKLCNVLDVLNLMDVVVYVECVSLLN